MSTTMEVTGGDKLADALAAVARNLRAGSGASVKVGFLAGNNYPDGTSIAMVAAIQEFGATIPRQEGSVTVYRKVAADGSGFLRNGRFVKRREANFQQTFATPAHDIVIPPRPFFRNAIKQYGPTWGRQIAATLKATNMDTERTLGAMGDLIRGQIQQSITDLSSPPNAPSTIAKKHSSKPLIDTGEMRRNVDYVVSL